MKVISLALMTAILFIFLNSCKPRRKSVSAKNIRFEGTIWKTPCLVHGDEVDLFSSAGYLEIDVDKFSFRRSYFADETCSLSLYSEVYKGNVKASHTIDESNLFLLTSSFVLHDPDLVLDYNKYKIFDRIWTKDQDEVVAKSEQKDQLFMTIRPESEEALILSTSELGEESISETFFRSVQADSQ